MEIKGGEGGAESALFAADLLRMYLQYAASKGWKTELLERTESDLGGYKDVQVAIKGSSTDPAQGVWAHLKYEGGVHRVQRVPATESQGRIHTSTTGVLVFPEVDEPDEVEINPNDLKIDVFRSSGPGGQSVNTTDSAVRITHLPTGIVVSMQNEKSQLQNREAGMRVLRARILAKQQEELDAAASDARKSQIRGMDRSERIRTYNFPENRIADHRTGYKAYNLDQVMDGALEPIIESAIQADEEARLAALGDTTERDRDRRATRRRRRRALVRERRPLTPVRALRSSVITVPHPRPDLPRLGRPRAHRGGPRSCSGFHIDWSDWWGFVLADRRSSRCIQSILSPWVFKITRRHAPAMLGGIGIIATFVALLIVVLIPRAGLDDHRAARVDPRPGHRVARHGAGDVAAAAAVPQEAGLAAPRRLTDRRRPIRRVAIADSRASDVVLGRRQQRAACPRRRAAPAAWRARRRARCRPGHPCVTTAFAPTTECAPIVIGPRIFAPARRRRRLRGSDAACRPRAAARRA